MDAPLEPRTKAPVNSAGFMIFFGLPGLRYTWGAKFGYRKIEPHSDSLQSKEG
jgi:hypothetical protein